MLMRFYNLQLCGTELTELDRLVVESQPSRVSGDGAADDLAQRTLAAPVGTNKGVNFTGFERKICSGQRSHAPKPLLNAARFQDAHVCEFRLRAAVILVRSDACYLKYRLFACRGVTTVLTEM